MGRYLLRRGGAILLTLLIVATITFTLTVLIPADPARTIVGPKGTPEQVARCASAWGSMIRCRYSTPATWATWRGSISATPTATAGTCATSWSTASRTPRSWPPPRLLVQFGIGVPLGLLTAARAEGSVDRAALAWTMLTISLPGFWIGLVLLYLFAFRLPIFPLGGASEVRSVVLPALALGLPGAAWYSRLIRDTALQTLHSEFVQALRARGIPARAILGKHVLRVTISPVLTMMAIDFGVFLGGAVLVESVFAWPGLGLTAYEAMQRADVSLLMATVLLGSLFVLVLNLLADLARVWIDPRVQLD